VLYKYKIGYGDYCMVPLLLPEAVMFGCCGGICWRCERCFTSRKSVYRRMDGITAGGRDLVVQLPELPGSSLCML
jgi:hypothetical protein